MEKAKDMSKYVTVKDFELQAKKAMPVPSFEYYRSGADDEISLK